MIIKNRVLIVTVVLLLILALPISALANPNKWIAKVSWSNELHQVVGSSANGMANIRSGATSYTYQLAVQGLTSAPTAAHLHAPADATQTAPVLITLCSGNCPALDANGTFWLQGSITSAMLQAAGITAQQFISYLNDGLVYVNVHTALNPAGEARGQFSVYTP